MVRLVDDLLDVSRISRGKIELRMSQLELVSAISEVVESVRPMASEMKHALHRFTPVGTDHANGRPHAAGTARRQPPAQRL